MSTFRAESHFIFSTCLHVFHTYSTESAGADRWVVATKHPRNKWITPLCPQKKSGPTPCTPWGRVGESITAPGKQILSKSPAGNTGPRPSQHAEPLWTDLWPKRVELVMVAAPHSQHRSPAPSSKLCHNWLRHGRGTLYLSAAVHWCSQRPLKCLGTNKSLRLWKQHRAQAPT